MKEKLIGILVCMLLITTVLSVSGTVMVERTSISTSLGNTLYVGGSGPGNYSTIQEAIDDASDGYTIYVYDDSSPYYEHILIDKSLILIGENRETTIIDGNTTSEYVVNISANRVEFSGFTVQNGGYHAGITVGSSNNKIHHCKVIYNKIGLWLAHPRKDLFFNGRNTIENNIFENNSDTGLRVSTGNKRCKIIGNKVVRNGNGGIVLIGSPFSTIEGNIITDNSKRGFFISNSNFNRIVNNEIRNTELHGLYVYQNNFNIITKNNFFDNGEDRYSHATFMWCSWQYWNKNYWNPRENNSSNSSKPYFIFRMSPIYTPVPFNIDWHPAQEPYDIG